MFGAYCSDLILILLSYCFILSAVMHLQSGGASTKALSTCGSHLILILFFYTLLLVFIFTNKAGKKCPQRYPFFSMSCTISSHQPWTPLFMEYEPRKSSKGLSSYSSTSSERCESKIKDYGNLSVSVMVSTEDHKEHCMQNILCCYPYLLFKPSSTTITIFTLSNPFLKPSLNIWFGICYFLHSDLLPLW